MELQSLKADRQLQEWMSKIRRTIHQNPELSFQEFKTSKFIQEKLRQLNIPFRNGLGGTGVVATIDANSTAGSSKKNSDNCRHVALRADMDALPVQEKNDISYASNIPGVMHACGHDGHVAMLLGAAALLQKSGVSGRVSCIFQPAEEHGNGAEKIIAEGGLDDGVEAVFGGHIDTHYQTGIITVDEGVICSCADPFTVVLDGKSGHAARPHEARDVIVAGAGLISGLQTLISREKDPNQAGVLTIGKFEAGRAHNIIADRAQIDGTIRSSHTDVRKQILSGLKRVVEGIGLQYGVGTSLSLHDCLPAVVNSELATKIARQAALYVVVIDGVKSQGLPSLGGEDFSFYQQKVEGCLVRFGAHPPGSSGPCHSTTFNFDENVLGVGAEWLAKAASSWLAQDVTGIC